MAIDPLTDLSRGWMATHVMTRQLIVLGSGEATHAPLFLDRLPSTVKEFQGQLYRPARVDHGGLTLAGTATASAA